MSTTGLATTVIAISTLLLLLAALHDLAVRTVPNVIPALLLTAGMTLRIMDGTVLAALLAAFCIFAATALFWLRGWMGGGDVKLYTACSLLVAPALVLPFVLASALVGGGLAVLYLVLKFSWPRQLPGARLPGARPDGLTARLLRCEARRVRRGGPLPYAAAISLGAIFTLMAA